MDDALPPPSCKPPNPTLLSPSLSLHMRRMGRTSSPHTTTCLTYNKAGPGRGVAGKVIFSRDFFK